MGFALIKKNSPKNGYDSHAIVEIMIDTQEDLQNLPVGFDAGSIAYTADRSVSATLNTKGKWVNHVDGGSGSGCGIPTAIIKQDGYDNALMGVAVAGSSAPTFTCTNMTYEEAKNVILSGQPLNVVVMMFRQDGSYTRFVAGNYPTVIFSILEDGSEAIAANYAGENLTWTSDGITVGGGTN